MPVSTTLHVINGNVIWHAQVATRIMSATASGVQRQQHQNSCRVKNFHGRKRSGMEHAVAVAQAAVVEDMRDGEMRELNVNPMSWA